MKKNQKIFLVTELLCAIVLLVCCILSAVRGYTALTAAAGIGLALVTFLGGWYISAHLMTPEAIKIELENLRNPIEWSNEKRIKILTFGNFDVFVDGSPLKFERKQAKEILAYLVDKRGTSATYPELAAMLWEDEEYDRTRQKNLQVYIASLVKTLHSVEVKDLILKSRQGILVNTKIVDCDYYRFLEGDVRSINSFTGQYMSAYSWAEFTVGYLENQMQKIK